MDKNSFTNHLETDISTSSPALKHLENLNDQESLKCVENVDIPSSESTNSNNMLMHLTKAQIGIGLSFWPRVCLEDFQVLSNDNKLKIKILKKSSFRNSQNLRLKDIILLAFKILKKKQITFAEIYHWICSNFPSYNATNFPWKAPPNLPLCVLINLIRSQGDNMEKSFIVKPTPQKELQKNLRVKQKPKGDRFVPRPNQVAIKTILVTDDKFVPHRNKLLKCLEFKLRKNSKICNDGATKSSKTRFLFPPQLSSMLKIKRAMFRNIVSYNIDSFTTHNNKVILTKNYNPIKMETPVAMLMHHDKLKYDIFVSTDEEEFVESDGKTKIIPVEDFVQNTWVINK